MIALLYIRIVKERAESHSCFYAAILKHAGTRLELGDVRTESLAEKARLARKSKCIIRECIE
jgi:hypothetical protein